MAGIPVCRFDELADGSILRFTKVPENYDVTDRMAAMQYLREHPAEVVTGILYADESVQDMHEMNRTPATALAHLPYEKLCPGAAALGAMQNTYR